MTLICGNEQFQAHKFVLRAASKIFDEMFKVNEESNSITVDRVSPEVFKDFLKFVYSGQVSMDYSQASQLFKVAFRYQVEDLREVCVDELLRNLSESNSVDILILAYQYGIKALMEEVLNYMKLHFAAILTTTSWKEKMLQHGELMDAVIRKIHL